MKRKHIAVGMFWIGLMKDRLSIGENHGVRIVKAAHSGHSSKIVIERTVFLHQQHDMLDVLKAPAGNRLGQSATHIGWQKRGGKRRSGKTGSRTKEPSPSHFCGAEFVIVAHINFYTPVHGVRSRKQLYDLEVFSKAPKRRPR